MSSDSNYKMNMKQPNQSNSPKNELIKLLQTFPDKQWNWNCISCNPNITMDYIEKYPEKHWNWSSISFNPNITIDYIEKHPDKPWDWNCIS